MFALMLTPPYLPFALALGLLGGLLAVELVALALGGSLMAGEGADAPGPDTATLEAQFDLAPGAEPDVTALAAAADSLQAEVPGTGGGALALLGLGRVPFAIWLAAMLTGFGVTGLAVQSVASATFGGPLGAAIAILPALAGAIGFARLFGRAIASLVPQVETTATSAQFMGGLRGIVSQGTARQGAPAEVRLRDRHGNTHYMRCEPFRDSDVIEQGTEVLTLRERTASGWALRIVALPA